jgi:hypothetical protein
MAGFDPPSTMHAPRMSVTLRLNIHILPKKRWKSRPVRRRMFGGSTRTVEREDVADHSRGVLGEPCPETCHTVGPSGIVPYDTGVVPLVSR